MLFDDPKVLEAYVKKRRDHYEKSDTQRFEVPRMLFDDPKVLEAYVKKRRDQNLQRWWAQYLESIGDFNGAKGFYQASKDYLSVIRLLCYKGLIDEVEFR
uniref:DDE_Tnp_ISL3 domain-containing protein n=1 Tax=Ascaris lumbricoides TaxID=6252 RepID=A0A0M3IML3_ASCLU